MMFRDFSMSDFISPASTTEFNRLEFTREERERLVFYKWRYVFMADGFTSAQARRLAFMRWLQLRKLPPATEVV